MQVVCEATQCADESVQVVALQNLVKIMSLYYQYMEAYMGPALFAVSPLLPVCSEREYYIKRNVLMHYTAHVYRLGIFHRPSPSYLLGEPCPHEQAPQPAR